MYLFFRFMSLFDIDFFIFYQAPHSRALAPACDALVFVQLVRIIGIRKHFSSIIFVLCKDFHTNLSRAL